MKTFRAILIGTAIWLAGVTFYSLSFYVSILENLEQQANIVLFVIVMPLVWFGSFFYYKKDKITHGLKLGQVFLLTAAVLDTLVTVPLFMQERGINHYEFFTSIGFWMIALEFIAISTLYYYSRVYSKSITAKQ